MNNLRVGLDNRRKVNVEDYLRYPSVRSWYDGKKSQKTMIYRLASFIDWRRGRGLSTDPEQWIEECLNGTNLTLINHAKAIEDWVNGEEMRQKDFSTCRRYSTDIKGLYLHHHIRMPRIGISRVADDSSVEFNVTATQYLEMATKALTHAGVPIRDRSIMMTVIQSAMDESTTAKVFNFARAPDKKADAPTLRQEIQALLPEALVRAQDGQRRSGRPIPQLVLSKSVDSSGTLRQLLAVPLGVVPLITLSSGVVEWRERTGKKKPAVGPPTSTS